MKQKINQFVFLMIMIFTLIILLPAAVWAQTSTKVTKVGYYEDGDYMSRNQQGEYVGYNIEFLQEIAKNSDILFEIVDTGSWNAAYDMLVSGEIDLLPAVYFSEERTKEIFFAEQPMCSIYTTLNVRMDDGCYDYEDFDAFTGMKVGIIKGGIDGERFREFCANNKIVLDIIEYDETDELLSALDDKTLDGVAITHLGKNCSYRSVAQFAPSPLYFTVSKKNPELLEELDRTMDMILLSNPGYSTDLYDKYLSPSSNQKPVFTKAELKYIEQANSIVVSYDPDFAPLSYEDKKTGEFKGIAADVFSFIEENSGLHFQFEPHTQKNALELLGQGKIDVLSVTDGDYLWEGRNHINSTLYYLYPPTSVITKNGTADRNILALTEGYQLSEIVSRDFPDSSVKYYDSVSDCLDAVCRGDADAVYVNTQVAGFYLDKGAYNELYEATLNNYTNKLCIGVSSETDSSLFSILNKCIQYLPTEQMDAYIIKNATNAQEVSLLEFVKQYIGLIAFIAFAVMGIIILLISINLRKTLRSNQRIHELLYKDHLTNLDNMDGFCKKWSDIPDSDKQRGFALLYGDICQFKLINDTFGFSAGNEILRACGHIFLEELKLQECCCRLSADNFVLLIHYDNWEKLTERLQTCVDKLNQWKDENTKLTYNIDFVFGIYLTNQAESNDIHQMMDNANYARLHAKQIHGTFAILYDEQMRKEVYSSKHLESSLEQALAHDEFEVYYQPKVSMDSGKVIGGEALIRWNHPEEGFLTPGSFIPLFEKNGMIKKVDFWLFEAVCKTMHMWEQQGLQRLTISCNFSRLHFKDCDFSKHVCNIADSYEIPHHLLEIEITESALMEDSNIIVEKLFELKKFGFQISIDDFGSGYSSLGQLQQLAADVLKLDRSFVNHASIGTREQIVLKNVIHMAEELGMTVICEGVETLSQSKLLQELGCRFAQGFYYYRPLAQKDYEKLI